MLAFIVRHVNVADLSRKIRKVKFEEKNANGYIVNCYRIYPSINSFLHVLSANHLFGNCAENRSLELLVYPKVLKY